MKINYKALTFWIIGVITLISIYFFVERDWFSFVIVSYFTIIGIFLIVCVIFFFKVTVLER